jgi:uncharacterized protein (DUF433 family)
VVAQGPGQEAGEVSDTSIKRKKGISCGRYCVGPYIPIFIIRGRRKAGESLKEIAEDYDLTIAQVRAALNFRKKSDLT